MTPEEYAAAELQVPGWDRDEATYVPGTTPSEQMIDPNIFTVLNGGPVQPEPTPQLDPNIVAMQHEYNFVLPLELRRAEIANLNARTGFWNSLATFITSLVGNAP
jgi:hypothetical protein